MKKRFIDMKNDSKRLMSSHMSDAKCKFAMQFYINDVPRFAIATTKENVKYKYNNINECFKNMCMSSLQVNFNAIAIEDQLIEFVKKSASFKEHCKNLYEFDSYVFIVYVNARYNEFKTACQNDFDLIFKTVSLNLNHMSTIAQLLTLKCNEIYVSETDDALVIEYNNDFDILLQTANF